VKWHLAGLKEWRDYVEGDICRMVQKLIHLESAPFLQLYGCVSQGLGTTKFTNLAEIDIDRGLDFPI